MDHKEIASFNQSDILYKNHKVKPQVVSGISASMLYASSVSPDNVVSPKTTPVNSNYVKSSASSSNIYSSPGGMHVSREADYPDSTMTNRGIPSADSNQSEHTNNLDVGKIQEPQDFGQYFQEEYCTASTLDGSHQSADIIANVDNIPGNMEKSEEEEDGDNDDMLGCVFAFSEEGKS